MKLLILPVLILIGSLSAGTIPEGEGWLRPRKKLIAFGWAHPASPEFFKNDLDKIENVPLDGFGMRVIQSISVDGKSLEYHSCRTSNASPIVLKKSDFNGWIEIFGQVKFKKLKHNFLFANTAQFNSDWFDDAAWAKTLNNHRILAWLAKEIGFEGMALDIESYAPPLTDQVFCYRPQSGKSFDETAAKVRERGREYGKAIAAEFPEIKLLAFYWLSALMTSSMVLDHQQEHLPVHGGYGLAVPFINGIYDAVPDTVTIIDGTEARSYKAGLKEDYDSLVADYYRNAPRLVYPENLVKYHKITQLGLALYLDAYNKQNKLYPVWRKSSNPAWLLGRNIQRTLDYTDEYVWIWNERGGFWPQKLFGKRKFPFWDELVPGAVEAIEFGRDPDAYAQRIADRKKLPNLLINGSFDQTKAEEAAETQLQPEVKKSSIPGWNTWQRKGSNGTFSLEHGAFKLSGVIDGAIVQNFRDFKQGEAYLLTAKCKTTGSMVVPSLAVTFRNSKGEGLWHLTQTAAFTAAGQDGEWRRASLFFDVPEGGIAVMNITCGVKTPLRGIPAVEDACYFDDIVLQKIDDLGLEKMGRK